MSYKRSRAEYEADLQKQQSPFVVYGTPLPPLDSEVRDDGSYVPVWKQEVRDERGRKRLHGAFTGGWSAGYFNTVGSKEGWTPSTFVSSRTNRAKDNNNNSSSKKDDANQKAAPGQRLEDFMDEEDLADAEESRRIQTSQAFAGLGASDSHSGGRAGGLAGLFHVQGETMGTKLLKKMGWREGQGVGPKVRRRADLDMRAKPGPGAVAVAVAVADADAAGDTYLFAPEDAPMVGFLRKTDRKGLGYEGSSRLAPLESSRPGQQSDDDDEDEGGFSLGRTRLPGSTGSKKKDSTAARGGIGIGVLNDTGSDDEDPYEVGPRISYNKILGGNKKKKKKESGLSTTVNPAVKLLPKFVPKGKSAVKATLGVRKCHDGRPPLPGFVLGQEPDPLISIINADGKYPPPEIPPDWKSTKKPEGATSTTNTSPAPTQYASAADAAKASHLDPAGRAALLGERQLPGKSVFDFLTSSARDRLAAATGKADLPQARGEVPEGYAPLTGEERRRDLLGRVPALDRQSAVGAMARGASGGGPYGDDDAKRARYRAYLELQAGIRVEPAPRPPGVSADAWLQEMHEFFNVARIFRPMTGSMASRFTTSSPSSSSSSTSAMSTGSDGKGGGAGLVSSKPPAKPEDPAEQAARVGMFGPMTRSVKDFHPSRLLCKRFNVKPPAHVQAEDPRGADAAKRGAGAGAGATKSTTEPNFMMTTLMIQDAAAGAGAGGGMPGNSQGHHHHHHQQASPADLSREDGDAVVVDTTRNDALEGKRAGEEVFKAIFGDSSDDEDS